MFERTAYPFIPPSIFILSSCRPKMSSDDESSSSSSPSLAVVKVVNDHAINTATTLDWMTHTKRGMMRRINFGGFIFTLE